MRRGHEAADMADMSMTYQRERKERRRALTNELAGRWCIDLEDVVLRAGPCDSSSLSRLTHRRLCARALAAEGVSVEDMARAWHTTPEQVAELVRAPLVDPEHRWSKIEPELLGAAPAQ